MSILPLQARMLGEFSITGETGRIDESSSRSRKVWLLLAYLIYNRNRTISQEELVTLLWGEETGSTNPANALKTLLHRVRAVLNQLAPGAGHRLIVRRNGCYAWNTDVPLSLDTEQFDDLCARALPLQGEERLALLLQAIELYRGDFLNKLSTEPWVLPLSTRYHSAYLQALEEVLPALQQRAQWQQMTAVCEKALRVDLYNEDIYQHLMRARIALGDQQGAAQLYEEMSQLLFSNFGILPADESRAIYREALRDVSDRAIPMGLIQEQLKEQNAAPGALICDYDFFKVLCHAQARAVSRSGDAVHIGLLTLSGEDGKGLTKRSLTRAMENLQEQIRCNLRRGDTAAQCSVSQFILLLPRTSYENSCMVCQRICKAFARQYPHSPAELRFSVHPLEPALSP